MIIVRVLIIMAIGFLTGERFIASTPADTLTLESRTSVAIQGNRLHVESTVTNRGDTSAHGLQVHLFLFTECISKPVLDLLDKGESRIFHFEKEISSLKKGRYPLTIRIDYHDANNYPFSAISCMTFDYREVADPHLVCLAKNLGFRKKGRAEFRVKNQGDRTGDVKCTLVLPKEFSTRDTVPDFRIDPGQEKTIGFEIVNLDALKGSSYPIFCLLESDSEDTHYTAIGRAVMKIEKSENWFRRTREYWGLTAIFLLALVIFYQSGRASAKNRSGKSKGPN